jgi:hypothetical protein
MYIFGVDVQSRRSGLCSVLAKYECSTNAPSIPYESQIAMYICQTSLRYVSFCNRFLFSIYFLPFELNRLYFNIFYTTV